MVRSTVIVALDIMLCPASLAVLLYGPQHFTDSIDSDGEHQEIDAMHKSDNAAENQPRLAADDVEAHGAQNQADADGEDCLENIVAAQPR